MQHHLKAVGYEIFDISCIQWTPCKLGALGAIVDPTSPSSYQKRASWRGKETAKERDQLGFWETQLSVRLLIQPSS